MANQRKEARSVASPRSGNGFWIDHAAIDWDDLEWLIQVERLILWNVTVPKDFLRRLPRLWWIDIRGGSATDLSILRGLTELEFLSVNQVRGFSDASELPAFRKLRMLDLYGLPKLQEIPSLGQLHSLERVQLGQLRGLQSIQGVVDAPSLRELLLSKRVEVSETDVAAMRRHSSLAQLHWNPEDIPSSMWQPVLNAVGLPRAEAMLAENWFKARGRAG